jgi:general secretion pathway protein D/MSHA biogenesis protein MshL
MMPRKNIVITVSLVFLLAILSSCRPTPVTDKESAAPQNVQQEAEEPLIPDQPVATAAPLSLPVRYQTPEYMVGPDSFDELEAEEITKIKVGASIRSTRGPQPLWDILKRLAALKKMNVSWASDVDQNALVDVDINANDDLYEAIDNLLRQVDYFHEMHGNTIVVKYKETRRFHIAMPFTKHSYSTGTGGNVLGSDETSTNIEGTIQLSSSDNEFDIWKNIQANMDAILNTWNTTASTSQTATVEKTEKTENTGNPEQETTENPVATRQISTGGSMYIIDKPIGMITVTAPRPLLERLEQYFTVLKSELYKQVVIEAKIIEVQLSNSSSIGINWSSVLDNFAVTGTIEFAGDSGEIYPTGDRFVSKVSLDTADFSLFLNALQEQGDTKVLSNPKISVMNGQPALITVGENTTYVDSIESDVDSDTGVTTYTVDTERILSGVGLALTATVLNNDSIIMNLVPVTSELQEPIEYLDIGSDGAQVGLPVVTVREMSTTVRMKDGEMLVIGGLISNTDDSSGSFAPVVGDIPVIRYLFGYEEKTSSKKELIILLKARITNWSEK